MSGYSGRNFLSFGHRIRVDGVIVRSDANRPGGFFPQLAQRRKRGLDLLKLGTNSLKETLACRRGRDLACGAR